MRHVRVEKRLDTIRTNISKLKDGKVRMYHVMNKGETQSIEEFCKEHEILHQIIVTNDTFSAFLFGDKNQFYSRDDKEYFDRRIYVRVWKGFRTDFDNDKPFKGQLVIHRADLKL